MLRDDVEEAAAKYESRLDEPLSVHSIDIERGSKCGSCEFKVGEDIEKSGFKECWGSLAEPKPHMLELFSIGTCKALDRYSLVDWMLRQQKASLLDIPEDCLVMKDGSIGANAERQRARSIPNARRGLVSTDFVSDEAPPSDVFIDFELPRSGCLPKECAPTVSSRSSGAATRSYPTNRGQRTPSG